MSMVKLLPHNQDTFKKMMKLYKISKKVCAIQATGTGKTFLICRLLEEWRELRAIVLSPNDEIIKQTEEYLKEYKLSNAECITYQKLLYMTNEKIKNLEVDLIIVDEFHRIGAEKWGRKVQHLLNTHPSAKVFGTTATPIRSSDGRDMSIELFDGNKACDISLAEAIVREIVKMPIYVSGLYSFDKEYNNMICKIENGKNSDVEKSNLKKELAVARRQLEKAIGVSQIIKKYITNFNSKYIVFCQNTTHLKQMIDVVQGWFRDAGYDGEIYSYSVGSKIKESKENMHNFKKNNKKGLKLLFCIDKLNEGLHMPKVAGVILLRPTKSDIIYYQQIGRVIDANREEPGIILDLVSNFSSLSNKVNLKDDLEKEIQKRKDGGYKECSVDFDIEKFHIYDEIQDCIEMFNSIDAKIISDKQRWTKGEKQTMIDLYPTIGLKVRKYLSNRSDYSIASMATELNLVYVGNGWTKEEDEILIKYYPTMGNKCKKYLPRKTTDQIRRRAIQLGLRKSRTNADWTTEEENRLVKNVDADNLYDLFQSKTKKQIDSKMKRMGLTRRKKTSKYKYVYYRNGKYAVSFHCGNKCMSFGSYENEDEAGRVAMEKAKEYGKAV